MVPVPTERRMIPEHDIGDDALPRTRRGRRMAEYDVIVHDGGYISREHQVWKRPRPDLQR